MSTEKSPYAHDNTCPFCGSRHQTERSANVCLARAENDVDFKRTELDRTKKVLEATKKYVRKNKWFK